MITRDDIGKKVKMFRLPERKDWPDGCGSVNAEAILGRELEIGGFNYDVNRFGDKILHLKGSDSSWYPTCCFTLINNNYEIY